MSRRPQFKSYFRVEIIPSEGVFLLSEKGYFLLRGATYMLLAPLLNGQYTVEQMIERLAGQLSAADVYYALELLRRKGYVVDKIPSMPPGEAAFWQMLDVRPEVVIKRLEERTLSVISVGEIDPAPFKAMLKSLGVRVGDDGKQTVVLTDDYLQPGLERFNEEALREQHSWMLVKPVGTMLWIGPLFIPRHAGVARQTACWACLAHRLEGHRNVERYLQEKKGSSGPFPFSYSLLPSTQQTALSIAATESLKWLVTGRNKALENKVVTLDTLSLKKRDHVLLRRTHCACCGITERLGIQSAKVLLEAQAKFFTSDGGHRILSPEETFEKLEHHISPITGIVSTLQPYHNGEQANGLLTSYLAKHLFVQSQGDLAFLRAGLRHAAYGKGKGKSQAKVSALCEAIERYSGVFQGHEPRIRATLNNLGSAAIHPNACMLFSKGQFEKREASKNPFTWVPEPFDEEKAIEWTPVWSLTKGEARYLPTAYCYYGYSEQFKIQFTAADSNGCAAGNCKEEAILQGFMELVERDAVALWWYNRLKKPAVSLESFASPYAQQLERHYKSLQRDLWVLDITSDFNIPTFAAISRRHDKQEEDIIFGFGTHFDAQIALLRALTELNQSLPMVAGSKSDKEAESKIVQWWKSATIANQPYLVPDEQVAPKVQADYAKQFSPNLQTDVMTCVNMAKQKGLETLVLDQTRPDVGLHVVKVIVPGMRHFWARFAPGRLYDVPVQMGWLMEPLMEEELNPEHIW